MKKLAIAPALSLPLEAVTESMAILARKGGGKSYSADVLAEEMFAADVPFVILDPKGDHWGLRSSADGKREGIPVTILGGEHSDLPLGPEDGRIVADLVVEHPGWYLLDISQFSSRAAEIRFGTEFAERLWRAKAPRANHWPMHLFVDEADMFVPQNTRGEMARSVGAYEVLGKQGRGRGLGITFISQRSAVINKNVLTQTEVLIVLQTTSPQDRKAVGEWFEGNATPEVTREVLTTLAALRQGEAHVYSPRMLGELARVQIRARRTFDSGRTPKVGETIVVPKKLAPVDVKAALERMASTIQKAKDDDPRELRRRIMTLEREARRKPVETKPVEVVPAWLLDELSELTGAIGDIRRGVDAALARAVHFEKRADTLVERAGRLTKPRDAEPPQVLRVPKDAIENIRVVEGGAKLSRYEPARELGGELVKKGARRILETLARHHPMRVTRGQLGTLARFRITGGTFQTYFSQLKKLELIREEPSGEISITDAGLAFVGHVEQRPQTTEETIDMWRQALKAGARRMLDELVAAYPKGLARDELAARLDMTPSGGTFQTYLSTLRRNGLCTVGDEIKASDTLFLEAVG